MRRCQGQGQLQDPRVSAAPDGPPQLEGRAHGRSWVSSGAPAGVVSSVGWNRPTCRGALPSRGCGVRGRCCPGSPEATVPAESARAAVTVHGKQHKCPEVQGVSLAPEPGQEGLGEARALGWLLVKLPVWTRALFLPPLGT